MLDKTMPDAHLELRLSSLDGVQMIAPPTPYRVRTFREGEEKDWCRITTASAQFDDVQQAMKNGFAPHFVPDMALLGRRMFFAVDKNDVPVATAAAWFSGAKGQLHWVGVDAVHQGRGLARPVISAALCALRDLGYQNAILYTQPKSWLAIRLYMEFGFRPVWSDDGKVIAGWKAVYQKLGKEFTKEECADLQ